MNRKKSEIKSQTSVIIYSLRGEIKNKTKTAESDNRFMTNENGKGNSSDEANILISFAREKSHCTTKQQEREKEAAQQNRERERKKLHNKTARERESS